MLRSCRCFVYAALVAALCFAPANVSANSGGYRRPAVASSSATSFSGTASSGGYRRPSTSSGGYVTGSGGDVAVSRGASAQALEQYRTAQQPRRPPPAAADTSSGYSGWDSSYQRRPPSEAGHGPIIGGNGFGSAAFWALLGALATSDRSAYFHQYQADPAYQQWHQQALRNPDTAARLHALGDPNAPVAVKHGGSGIVWLVLFLGVGAFVLLWLVRRRAAAGGGGKESASGPPGLSGSKAMRFRVGQTMPLDPTPFVLAAGTTKVQPPPEGNMISVEAVGLLEDGGARLHRLYLPGRNAFFQLHLGADGAADECRYFSKLDEVQPADAAEWGQWLDPNQGMIGWPAFETKDGKTYGRVWAAGNNKVAPRQQTETVQTLAGISQRRLQTMLYGGPTGAAPPAPSSEYVQVAAVEADGQAWVEIHAGIDVNPAALTLPAVPI